MKKVKVFTNNDLDGAGSLLTLKWAIGDKCILEHSISNIFDIKNDYQKLINSALGDEYAKIFILNMIPDFDIDDRTMVFSKSVEDGLSIRGQRARLGKNTTTTKLMNDFFSSLELTDEQKEIVTAIDDYYTKGVSSRNGVILSALLHYGNNRNRKFYERFNDGIGELGDDEKDIVKDYTESFINTFKGIELVEHCEHQGVFMAIIPNMKMKHQHELLQKIFEKYQPEKMVFVLDIEDGLVSVRKNDSYDFDMSKLCNELIVGRSLINWAGGRFTEKFIDFTKSFY